LLDCITRVLLQPNKKEITTYKILRICDSQLNLIISLNSHIDSSGNLVNFVFPPIGEWISCYIDFRGTEFKDINIKTRTSNEYYSRGFHCFLSLNETKKVLQRLKTNLMFENCIICKCSSKYRMVFGLQKFSFCDSDEIIWAKMVVCRGLRIDKIMEV